MDLKQAGEVADLLNERNKLVNQYTPQAVHQASGDYLLELSDEGCVVGCAKLRRLQWYQYEISHVSVRKDVEGKGVGWRLLKQAEQVATEGDGRIIQCTIRADNQSSQKMFNRNGYLKAAEFFYPLSGNMVEVWQKSISLRP